MHADELPVQDIADRFGVSRAKLYRNVGCLESPKALKTGRNTGLRHLGKFKRPKMAETSGDGR
jgi:predicted DNA-binding transcriptional regulator AlpA